MAPRRSARTPETARWALRRYQTHAAAAPPGWPRGVPAHRRALGAPLPGRTIEGLDQLTRRMRAHATADDLQRLAAQRRRADGRRLADDSGSLSFRPLPDAAGRWPKWVLRDADGDPVIVPTGQQAGRWVDEHHPFPGDTFRRLVERDAFLLAGRLPRPSSAAA